MASVEQRRASSIMSHLHPYHRNSSARLYLNDITQRQQKPRHDPDHRYASQTPKAGAWNSALLPYAGRPYYRVFARVRAIEALKTSTAATTTIHRTRHSLDMAPGIPQLLDIAAFQTPQTLQQRKFPPLGLSAWLDTVGDWRDSPGVLKQGAFTAVGCAGMRDIWCRAVVWQLQTFLEPAGPGRRPAPCRRWTSRKTHHRQAAATPPEPTAWAPVSAGEPLLLDGSVMGSGSSQSRLFARCARHQGSGLAQLRLLLPATPPS